MPLGRREVLHGGAACAVNLLVPEHAGLGAAPAVEWSALRMLSRDRNGFDDSPALAAGSEGGWAVWLARKPGDREELLARALGADAAWGPATLAAEGSFERPAVACLPGGAAIAACVECADGAWRVRAVLVGRDRCRSLTGPRSPGKPVYLAMASGPDGSVWLAWEAWRRGRMLVCLSRYGGGRWGATKVVAGEEQGAYDPVVACAPSGDVWVAWAANEPDGHRSIRLAAFDAALRRVHEPITVARGGSPRGTCALNSHPSVACDGRGRVWVAWEHDGPDSLRRTTPQNANWLGRRHVSAVCLEGDGLASALSGPVVFGGRNDHLPALCAAPDGTLLAVSRVSLGDRQPGPGLFEDRRAWDIRISRLDESGWTRPVALLAEHAGLPEMGRLHPPAVMALRDGSIVLAWQADTYQSKPVAIDQQMPRAWVNTALLRAPAAPAARAALQPVDLGPAPSSQVHRHPRLRRRQVSAPEGQFTVIWGNCHEHTLLSRCWGDGSDATLDEDYRYGFDVEGYDFIAMTDHCFDSWEPVWRCTRRAAALYNDPPHVVASPAYEWTALAVEIAPNSGHRNIVLAGDEDARRMLDGDKVLAFDRPGHGDQIRDVWDHMRRRRIEGVTIPHHTADAGHTMNWDYHDPDYQTAVEIFQCRLSCEHRGCPRQTQNAAKLDGAWVWDALARGHRLGFVASGDHNNMGMGRSALLVREVSQAGVVEALRSRRCFATTGARIHVDFRVDGHVMGSVIVLDDAHTPTVTARIDGAAPLREVCVISNCRVAYSVPAKRLAGRRTYALEWVDEGFDGSVAWYYLRAVQADNEIVWSSPIWVSRRRGSC